ncbi:hypothetical protein P9B03_18375 [Metasolibacillus meyeri]|uniref:Transposase n=1 Tax=Metasolibacillus meyeri TaxID=1071052 RepID=A0AAW9NS55_9BACL|nr:hypothetical protein [Metasolibacillus meyeri]MEC1180467.1 hypothetical protein [Metasolibacillus meyeri]
MKKEQKEKVVLIASAPKGYGEKIVERQLSQMKKENATLQRKLSEIKRSVY